MSPYDPDDVRRELDLIEEQAQGTLAAVARLRATLTDERKGLPEPATRKGLPGRRAPRAMHAASVEGELADEPLAVEAPAPDERALAAGRHLEHHPRPFALVYLAFAAVCATLIASSHWPTRGWAVGLGLAVAIVLLALAWLPPLAPAVWRLEPQGPKRPVRLPLLLLLLAALLSLPVFFATAAVAAAFAVAVVVIALAALGAIAHGWRRQRQSRSGQ